MKIKLSNQIKIDSTKTIQKKIIKQFTFDNPKYHDAVSFGRSTRGIDKKISLCDSTEEGIVAPIGILSYLVENHQPEIVDQRTTVEVHIPFIGILRPYQESFIETALQAKGGLMIAATGSGKTVSGIAVASRLNQRTLVLVKSKDLAEQWKQAIKNFTGLDSGLIGGGKNSEGEHFTIGLTQTLCKRDLSQLNYGLVIADECHNLPASQAYSVINGLNSQYKFGLSATPQRRDNLEFMIHGALGEVSSEIKQDQLQGKVLPVQIKTIDIPFDAEVNSWAEFLNVLVDNESRNRTIINHAIKASRKMGAIILCSQVRHCEILGAMLREREESGLVLHGQLATKVRQQNMEKAAEANLIIGTLSLLSEGIDLPHLKALIFAAPVSAVIDKESPAATRLIQSIGRCRRPYKGQKKAYVLDLVDQCGFGVSAFNKRLAIYKQYSFKVN